MKRVLPQLAIALACASFACEDEVLVRKKEPELRIDELKQKPAALVDILWVVDNSGSMFEEQKSLARNFDRFIGGLTRCQGTTTSTTGKVDLCDFATKKCTVSGAVCNPPDYHIGVVATDVRSNTDSGRLRRAGLCVPALNASPANGKFRYCRPSRGAGNPCAVDASNPDSDPANNVCDMGQAVAFVSPTTPGAASAFAAAVTVGIDGSGNEQGIRSAAMAVGRDAKAKQNRNTDSDTCRNVEDGAWCAAPSDNDGFLRKDASLFVVFVSDENDSSFGEVSYFYRAFETLKGAGNEGQVSVSAIVGDPDLDGTGPALGGCLPPDSPTEDSRTSAGWRYMSLAMYSRGLSSEFRVCDGKRLTCGEQESCLNVVEGLPGICTPSAGCQRDEDCGTFACGDGTKKCVRCVNASCKTEPQDFVEMLELNGIFGSICEPNFTAVLDSLGFQAAGLARRFELTRPTDCTKTVRCCEGKAPDDTTCTNEVAVCVKVNGKPITNARRTGWSYQSSTHAIFFEGDDVPPTDANVTIAYRVALGNSSTLCSTELE